MPHKKNIAFVIHSLNAGGAERVLTTLANELTARYNVFIITLIKCKPFYPLNESIVLKYSFETISNNNNKFYAILKNINHLKNLTKISKENNIDLLIAFTTTSNVIAILASKIIGIKSIISERNNPIIYPPNRFWTFLRNISYPFADYLVVQTKANKQFFQKYINSNKIGVILNPIAKTLEANRNLNYEKNNLIILSVGRLNDNKSQDLLLKAFANIPNKGWSIFLVGDGPNKDIYINLAKKLEISNQVIFTGNSKDIYNYYNMSSIFVFTSKSEGLPNALIEALYFGLPSISTDCPNGPSELIDNGKNGYLIDVDDQKALEFTLQGLMQSSELRVKFSKNAVNSSSNFELSKIIKTWNGHIDQLT